MMGVVQSVVSGAAAAAVLASCTISTTHPQVLLDNAVPRRAVVTEIDPSTATERYTFMSWLSFPAVGPWTYEVGDNFNRYAEAFARQAFSAGDTTSAPLRLRLVLTNYEIGTFYRGSCGIRATLVEPASGTVLLDRNYVGIGRTAFQRVLWGGWFFGVGTRSAVQATMQQAFTAALRQIAADVSSRVAVEKSRVNTG